jgi:hypothetical protein
MVRAVPSDLEEPELLVLEWPVGEVHDPKRSPPTPDDDDVDVLVIDDVPPSPPSPLSLVIISYTHGECW